MAFAMLWTLKLLPAVPAYAPTCFAADETSGFYMAALAALLGDTDSQSVALRSQLQLPQLASNEIILTISDPTCSNAAAALDAAQEEPNPDRRMYVFELGTTRYAVVDVRDPRPAHLFSTSGGGVFFFDREWKVLSAVAM